MPNLHVRRIAALTKKLNETHGAMLLSSAPQAARNRDTHYPYRQNSDFFYLTGSTERDLNLLISFTMKRPLLIAPKADPKRVLWEGKQEHPKKLAASLGADLVISDDPHREILPRLKGAEVLYYQSADRTPSFEIATQIASRPSHERRGIPSRIEVADSLITPLRLIKDPEEVETIRKAIAVTESALEEALAYLAPGVPERFLQATVDYWFRVYGGSNAFTSIVGSGAHAAILHYERGEGIARKSDLVLIDCGAEYECYASDITRCFPASGRFEGVTAEVYDIVLAAQEAAIKKVKSGIQVGVVYDAAARVLTEGLLDLKVLKGKLGTLLQNRAYLPYFPHGIGHTLGIDVHDVGNFRGNNAAVLEEGMVITVEPGLYFPRKTGKVPACGVRIEDDVLVTKSGAEVLTAFPKKRAAVEEVMEATQNDLL